MINLLAFILGAVSTPLLPRDFLLPPAWLVAAAAVLLAAWCSSRHWLPERRRLAASFFAGFCLTLAAAVATAGVQRIVERALDEGWHGQNLTLRGTVVEVIDRSSKATRFRFRVSDAHPAAAQNQLRQGDLRLSWYYGAAPAAGEAWELEVRLKRPRGFVNPRGFDYAAWLLAQDLVATGYVRSGQRLTDVTADGTALARWRKGLAKRAFAREQASTPFFRALLLGDKSTISGDQWRVLQRTGTIHLMAISGLHVGLVAGIGYFLGWLLARPVTLFAVGRALLPPGRWLPPVLSCSLALFYSAMAGFSIPTQRAILLVLLTNLALFFGLRVGLLRLLALACALILVASPLAPTQNGFWLSFLAVVVLVAGFGGRRFLHAPVGGLVKAQLLLAVGLLAPLLALGQGVSLVGPLANLVAVPVVSLLIVPGLLLTAALALISPDLAALFGGWLDTAFQLLWQYLALLAELSLAQWWPAAPTTTGLLLAVTCGTVLLLAPRGLYLRTPGALLLVFALLAPRESPPPLKLVAVEVGQGLAVWLRAGRYNLLYDTGPSFGDDFDAGSRIVAPFLQSQGVKRLDTLIVSHGDSDHRGGLDGILRNMPHGELLAGDTVAAGVPDSRRCVAGDGWQREGVDFRLLWPPADSDLAGNNGSCVLLVDWQGHRILLLGDVDSGIERQLVAKGVVPRHIDLVIAAHHGSKTSSSTTLVEHLRPQAVIFSAGYQNRYGHPHPEVVQRYRRVGARVYITGESGAISFVWEESGIPPTVEKAREAINRAWY